MDADRTEILFFILLSIIVFYISLYYFGIIPNTDTYKDKKFCESHNMTLLINGDGECLRTVYRESGSKTSEVYKIPKVGQ